ncbi:MAG: DUF4422 domain-containing protein [Coriobacteriales bacterium]|nr:DUF4422 domain-containing protein [Coriobacteriales bacterium]
MPSKLTIVVAAHKQYWMPSDPAYVPVWVNAAQNGSQIPAGWQRDDAGDNISHKNPSFCELTALYWAWKNLQTDWLGLAHYRRHFCARRRGDKRERIATSDDLWHALAQAPIILPKKRRYYIETTYKQYVHAHHEEDLATTRSILAEKYPSYLAAYDASMRRTAGHRFNMFVMRQDLACEYLAWLFDVLFELEARLDTRAYNDYDRRVFGFVSERLLDPWVETRMVPYAEMPVVNLESQHWLKKGTFFVARKVSGGRIGNQH